MIAYLFLFVCLFQDNVPYKAEEDFIIKFEFAFRKRSDPNAEDLVLSQVASSSYDRGDSSPLPHLKTTLQILKKDSLEVKFRIVQNNSTNFAKRKIELGAKVTVFSVFVDDVKDKIEGYQYSIYFLDKDGVKLNRIVIDFDEDGFYSVNGKKKGKI
jgi:hypothetical protein